MQNSTKIIIIIKQNSHRFSIDFHCFCCSRTVVTQGIFQYIFYIFIYLFPLAYAEYIPRKKHDEMRFEGALVAAQMLRSANNNKIVFRGTAILYCLVALQQQRWFSCLFKVLWEFMKYVAGLGNNKWTQTLLLLIFSVKCVRAVWTNFARSN